MPFTGRNQRTTSTPSRPEICTLCGLRDIHPMRTLVLGRNVSCSVSRIQRITQSLATYIGRK